MDRLVLARGAGEQLVSKVYMKLVSKVYVRNMTTQLGSKVYCISTYRSI